MAGEARLERAIFWLTASCCTDSATPQMVDRVRLELTASGLQNQRSPIELTALDEWWWTRCGLNARPFRCERSTLPLSYEPTKSNLVEPPRIELGTYALPTRRSPDELWPLFMYRNWCQDHESNVDRPIFSRVH